MAIHNIQGTQRRDLAIDEAWRVLRPGGRLLIADIFKTDRYIERLCHHGARDVERRSLGWRMWWSGPWVRTILVSASKGPRGHARALRRHRPLGAPRAGCDGCGGRDLPFRVVPAERNRSAPRDAGASVLRITRVGLALCQRINGRQRISGQADRDAASA